MQPNCQLIIPLIKNKMKAKKVTVIEWSDSYGALSGWIGIEDYNPTQLVCTSCGFIVYEDKKVVALAPNHALSTTYTPEQANGLMVIPKSCILRITSFCPSFVSKQKRRQS